MTDNRNLKITIFTGINDTPVAPTATQAGNGSDLIDRFNKLIDNYDATMTSLIDSVNNLTTEVNTLKTTVSNLENQANNAQSSNLPSTTLIAENVDLEANSQLFVFDISEEISVERIKITNANSPSVLNFYANGQEINGSFSIEANSVDFVFDSIEFYEQGTGINVASIGENQSEITFEIVTYES